MSGRTWRIDEERGRPAADGGIGVASGPRPSDDGGRGPGGPVAEPTATASVASRFRRCRDGILRLGRSAWAGAFGDGGGRFEEALHRIAGGLEKAAVPEVVEAALIRMARELAPRSRIALIRTRGEDADAMGNGPASGASEPGSGHANPEWARRPEETVLEIPLSCGAAVHGRLRLFTPRRRRSTMRPRTFRRIATACTMAACVLENLRRDAEWAWQGRDEAIEDDRPGPAPPHPPAVARDATFLNAVLPFALAQARRHREPVSLLCLGIDRLAAIRGLLGPEVADRIVQGAARSVGSVVRSSDIVARLDDNRIVVLLMRSRGSGGISVARIIGRAVAESTRDVPELPATTVSIGVAEFPTNARGAISLIEAADDALARAQARGSNQIEMALAPTTEAPSCGPPKAERPVACRC